MELQGQVRAKPPLPAHKGAFGQPDGADAYRDLGYGRSRGTMPIQLAGNVKHRGLFEAGFGLTLGEIVDDIGARTATGRPAGRCERSRSAAHLAPIFRAHYSTRRSIMRPSPQRTG